MQRSPLLWILSIGLLLLTLTAPYLLRDQQYWLFVATQAYFWAMLASSWALLAGYAGQFSFAHIAFMAIGAYTSGILGAKLGWSPLSGIIIGTILATLMVSIPNLCAPEQPNVRSVRSRRLPAPPCAIFPG